MESDYCPICGALVGGEYSLVAGAGLNPHQCDPKKLAARDAALNKGDDARLQGHSLQERLKDGFEMLGDEQ